MPILCLDTATTTARVALIDEKAAGAVLASREATAARHSSNVLRLCDEVLREGKLTPASLHAIACGAGPGIFTGLRVGLAVAKGLAMPTGVPLVLVSSLAAMALDIFGAAEDAVALPCLDAGKGDVHAQLLRRDAVELAIALGEPVVSRPENLASSVAPGRAPVALAGGGADRHAAQLAVTLPAGWRHLSVAGPTAASVGLLAIRRLAQGITDDLERSVPVYGRAPDITVKKTREK